MTTTWRRAVRDVIVERGWQPGTDIEDRAARRLSSWFEPGEVAQQHKIGRYRLDFAWLDVKVALEVDGPRHLFDPATARKDAERDAWMRAQGWLVFRVHDQDDDPLGLDKQLSRVASVVRLLRDHEGHPARR